MKAVFVAAILVLAVNSASVKVPDEDAPLCEFCKAGIREWKVIMADKYTIDQLNLQKAWFCKYIPVPDCDNFWDTNIAKLDELIDGIDENSMCKQMEWCDYFEKESSFQKIFSPAPVGDDNAFCEYCHDFLGELKKVSTDPDVLIMNKDLPKIVCNAVDLPGCMTAMTLFFKYGLEYCQNIDINKTCVNWTVCKEMTSSSENKDTCAQCTQVADLVMTQLQNKMNFGGMSGKDMCGFVGLC